MLNLSKYNIQAPRYTSYPTAPHWEMFNESDYREALHTCPETIFSLYIHIPFCASMCLFCGCSVILNRRAEHEEKYVDYLCQEISLAASQFHTKKYIAQLHFGGGTPTKLSSNLLEKIMEKLHHHFTIAPDAEMAIEIDPRTVFADEGKKLIFLKSLGFNRISFGVQDTNAQVQAAIKRHQSLEMTNKTFHLAKDLGFKGINIDLIYGLPFQRAETFAQTISDILALGPDRIALFSYAKIPELKAHQRAICDDHLPSTLEKFTIYENARKRLLEAGYVAIGMDHFAKKDDELAISYREKRLQRNFQGYTVKRAEALLGLGVTAIGNLVSLYIQNYKNLDDYYRSLDQGKLPVCKGKKLSSEDSLRRWVIHTLMCHCEIDKSEFSSLFLKDFDLFFWDLKEPLLHLETEGLIKNDKKKLQVTDLGELFIRNVVMIFDAYLPKKTSRYSYSI